MSDPAEVFEVGERPDDDLVEASVLAVTDHVCEIDGHYEVNHVDGDEERVSGQ